MPPLKITTIGDGMIGKTCMLITHTKNEFPEEYVPTVYENHTCNLSVDGKDYTLTLWDTAGQEDFDRVRSLSYPNTDCFIICYSISNRASFNNVLSKWYPEIQHCSPSVPIILVGTKSDLRYPNSEKFVTLNEAKKLKQKIKAKALIECSAIEKKNIDAVFLEAVRAVVKKPNVTMCPCTII
ncbi:ras-like GTP-binding protein RhoL [Sitodiplosis mosellana]|uniref:ras-like GTP-binding protein RhoL n=1 Tax=Sitodiplosis mosellana TaxID=263140 RepID=UPI002443AC78|nr:ras-like GTP-binding protein RhoL [Sitodiplosis mosellana]XP_055298693.1 ras-like GTP-binding protein RhoL [Sitodiplosis mosellana]